MLVNWNTKYQEGRREADEPGTQRESPWTKECLIDWEIMLWDRLKIIRVMAWRRWKLVVLEGNSLTEKPLIHVFQSKMHKTSNKEIKEELPQQLATVFQLQDFQSDINPALDFKYSS